MIGEIRQNFTEASASVGLILATALPTDVFWVDRNKTSSTVDLDVELIIQYSVHSVSRCSMVSDAYK